MSLKTILIDGLQTLKNKFNYTIKDEIFRFLSSKIDENFQIMVLTFSPEDETEAFELFPECMFKNIIFYNRNMGMEVLTPLNKNESIVLTNTNEAITYFRVFGFQNIYEIKNFMKSIVEYPIIDMVDFIFAFGFNEKNFIQFCKENNSRGIIKSEIVYDVDYPTSLTFWVDSSKDYDSNYREFNIFSITQVNSGEYELKKDGNIMAVLYQGNDEYLATQSDLPMLCI
jgi:hypothetical protein